jgi:hypothetical protein
MNWMVAIDFSPDSFSALKTALHLMNKETDTLFLIHVMQRIYKGLVGDIFRLCTTELVKKYGVTGLDKAQTAVEQELQEKLLHLERYLK